MSGVPGPACAPPPKIFPNGNGHLASEFGEDPEKVLNELQINRYCCRRMLLTTVETIQQVIPFYESIQKRKQEVQSELD